jgi:hypothetical protein
MSVDLSVTGEGVKPFSINVHNVADWQGKEYIHEFCWGSSIHPSQRGHASAQEGAIDTILGTITNTRQTALCIAGMTIRQGGLSSSPLSICDSGS